MNSPFGPEPVFAGVGVALVTLFDDTGAVDAAATGDLAAQLVELGVRAVVVAGSTGEAASLSPEERTALVTAVRARVPAGAAAAVIVGTGAPESTEAAELTTRARDDGADAVLALSPPGSADLVSYYEQVAKAADSLPVLGYHFPAVSAPGIPVQVLGDLPITGVKDSTADADRLFATISTFRGHLYTGSSALVALAGAVGCAGAILALANARPELCQEAFDGSLEAQRQLVADHLRTKAAFPQGIKGLVAERFGMSTAYRLSR